uniref:Uncharacterized protein n=1 Tax=Peronospora matthiolae TaxID=2874970 RepID=A0AAV1T2S8_9STRA
MGGRQAWKIPLTAYLQAFSASDDVVLVLHTNGYRSTSSPAGDFVNTIHKFASETLDRPLNELPNIHVLPQYIPQKTWPSSYKANNALILPSLVKDGPTPCKDHGDGASCDYDASEWHNSVHDAAELTPEGAFRGHKSVKHLHDLLVQIKQHPEEAVAKGKQARKDMVDKHPRRLVVSSSLDTSRTY